MRLFRRVVGYVVRKTCESKFDTAKNCAACAVGHINYPTCTQCTSGTHCSGNAAAVSTGACWQSLGKGCCQTRDIIGGGEFKTVDECQAKCKTVAGCDSIEWAWKCSGAQSCASDGIWCNFLQGTCASANIANCPADKAALTGDVVSLTYNADCDGTCVCQCEGQWTGSTCDACDSKFDQTTCKRCANNHIGYPNCVQCDVDVHCSGRATSVASDSDQFTCVCQCENQWTGAKCDVCPPNFYGSNCDACTVGHVGYPTCTPCTVANNCHNRASAVTSNQDHTKCICTCQNSWTDDDCGTCPPRFDSANSRPCDKCSAGNHGYPICGECTNDVHCSGHATSVTSSYDHLKCECTCRNHWSGDKCEICPDMFGGTDCDQCADGYYKKDPADPKSCDRCDSTFCNGNSRTVTSNGDHTGCICTCAAKWEQPLCATCPSEFDQTSCQQCAEGRIDYPTCRECNVVTDCSSHAGTNMTDPQGQDLGDTQVYVYANGDKTQCICKCNPGYEGGNCEKCSEGYVKDGDNCVQCTTDKHCTGHATTVTSSADHLTCTCSCSTSWEGASCELCADKYDKNEDCGQCAIGHIGYPLCQRCESDVHCSGHAVTTTSDSGHVSCTCQCADQWKGVTCNVCPSKFGGNCDECADGFVNYPECVPCTVNTHCNGHAKAVTSNTAHTQCLCTCQDKWTGPTCASCPGSFLADEIDTTVTPQWKQVARIEVAGGKVSGSATTLTTGSIGANADCTTGSCKLSDVAINGMVNSYGVENTVFKVTVNGVGSRYYRPSDGTWTYTTKNTMRSGICAGLTQDGAYVCWMDHLWGGVKPTEDGVTYGDAIGLITLSNRGLVSPSSPLALCPKGGVGTAALNGLHGLLSNPFRVNDRCNGVVDADSGFVQISMLQMQPKASCDTCSAGNIRYPDCTPCDVKAHCTDHATDVTTDLLRTHCVCTCTDSWTGATCSACPSNVDPAGCKSCAAGYITYPDCDQCTSAAHCNGHATASTSNQDHTACTCTCADMYKGEACGECTVGNVKGHDAAVDAPCFACSIDTHCSKHATSVTSSGGFSQKCVCTCSNQWTGDTCNTCPAEFSGSDCDQCAVGYINYPTCTKCDIATHCSGHARVTTSTPAKTACSCDCTDQWTGDSCGTCPSQFGGAECKVCAKDHVFYPECRRCDLTADCHGRADSVTSTDGATCQCACKNQWQGTSCTLCKAGFDPAQDCKKCAIGYVPDGADTCRKCSTTTDCTNHATFVTSDGATCECRCLNSWSGDKCETCPPIFGGATCGACAPTHVSKPYPVCEACEDAVHCNNHGTASGDTVCVCACHTQWSGSKCSHCPAQFTGANCDKCAEGYRQVTASPLKCQLCGPADCTSHSTSETSSPDNLKCACTCQDSWGGEKCETCDPKYSTQCNSCAGDRINYPTCTDCTSAVHCNDNAVSSSANGIKTSCDCVCKAWLHRLQVRAVRQWLHP